MSECHKLSIKFLKNWTPLRKQFQSRTAHTSALWTYLMIFLFPKWELFEGLLGVIWISDSKLISLANWGVYYAKLVSSVLLCALWGQGVMPPIFIYFLLALFSFVLANESTPLLFTFGSAFIRRCTWKHDATHICLFIACCFVFVYTREWKHSTLIIYYYLPLTLLLFGGAKESMMPPIYLLFISCWLCFRSYSQTKALHSYLLLLLLLFHNPVSANKSNPLWLLIISCWFCFCSYLWTKAWCHPYLFISCWLCFRSYSQTKAIHPTLIYYYLLLALLSFIPANEYTPIPYFNNKRQYRKVWGLRGKGIGVRDCTKKS